MNKMIISENRLRELLNESIYEVLNESEFDEGFGHWLGNKFQSARNKYNNFVNDFRAGQNDARERNKDYNPYGVYGDREDDVRRMGNGAYPNYRYNLEKSRNQQARGETPAEEPTAPTPNDDVNPQNNGTQPHPSLVNQQQSNSGETSNAQPKDNNISQGVNGKNTTDYTKQDNYAELNRVLRTLKQNGVEAVMKDGKIVSFKSAQGNKTPEQNALIQQARRNPIIAKNMYESEMKKLKKQLNELLESYNKISRK